MTIKIAIENSVFIDSPLQGGPQFYYNSIP